MEEADLKYQTEKGFTVFFQDKRVGSLKLDLIVEGKVIIEVKALTGNIPDVFKYRTLLIFEALDKPLGFYF